MKSKSPFAPSEKEFRQQVLDLMKLFRWKAYFTWGSIHSPAGFPDICAVRLSRILIIELKSETGKVTEEQAAWLKAFELTGKVEVYIWRPLDRDEIERVLR